MGGKLLLKLNIGERPIADKYREGKAKSTPERGVKRPETVCLQARKAPYGRDSVPFAS